ncbi:lipase family protein [Xanthomonas translucens]|uniref:lipase family protein n=1 Tax=Xanthomonas campestris pv. translucens TaxID=343 RepID=UPI001F291D94|nr:lipase family protein [Xanthomonas translucens]UKE49727.1 lipase family protein [Xanthomonas translucens]
MRAIPQTQAPLDPSLTLAMAQASIAAYAAFEGKPVLAPCNYRLVARWSGWDGDPFGGSEELFGLLFQSTEDAATCLFAFRGTDSDLDVYEDLDFSTADFVPSAGTVTPTPRVSAGFYRIYDGKSGSMRASMREQVFALLAHFAPSQVYVTGHSLGGALSQLFSLDLALSQPAVRACNINFCSPMVCQASWGQAYAQSIAAADSTRCFNYWDYVPSLPPSTFDYVPVGQELRTAHDVRGALFVHPLSRHAIANMQTVLQHALPLTPQLWSGTFPDCADPRRLMLSQVPPMQAQPAWADVELGARGSERLPGLAPCQPVPASAAG